MILSSYDSIMHMQRVTEIAITRGDTARVFTREQAGLWAGSVGPSLDGLLKRAVQSGEVWRLHRGLYCLSSIYWRPDPFALAGRISGPSYLSFETALAYHGWIPEGVYTVTSATSLRSSEVSTSVARFSFTRVPQRLFMAGVDRVVTEAGSFLMATPLKALADLVYAHRKDWLSLSPVTDSLRIDPENLGQVKAAVWDEVQSAYSSTRVLRFLSGARKELGL